MNVNFDRLLVNHTPDALIVATPDGAIVFWNAGAQSLYGYSAEEAVGQSMSQLMAPADRIDDETKHFESTITKGISTYKSIRRKKDGALIYVDISNKAVHDAQGAVEFVLSSQKDVTDIKALRDASKNTEQALSVKNIELQNAVEEKNRFFSNMSHELRTPINAIIGFTGVLLMQSAGPLNANQEKQLSIVQISARHLLSLINDMLDLAKVESGKVEILFESLSCADLIEEVARTVRPSADKKGLQLRISVPESETSVLTDRRALSQILINLTDNAIKFSERGVITIALTQKVRNQTIVTRICITDTGCGIKLEDQPKLFQAFTQIDSSSTRKFEGTGLGLHLSQKLAEVLRGHISFESEYGKGSAFTLELSTQAE